MVMRLIAGAVLFCAAAAWSCGGARAEAPAASDHHAKAEATDSANHSGKTEGHGEGEASGGEGLNPITFHGMNFPGDLTVWTAVVFVIVMLILAKFAWGPIAQGLEKREQQIATQIAEAHQHNEDARKILGDYEKKLAGSQDEVQAILDQARRRAEQLGRQLLEKTKEQAVGEHQRAVQQIEAATSAALKELAERSATLAVDLAGKIVRSKLNPQDHSRLIQDAVSGFKAQGTGKK